MHANANAIATVINPSLVPLAQVRTGQHFIRASSPNEVLVLLSYAGMPADESESTWAVVVAVNHNSDGYVPGQLVKMARTTHVRLVTEARAPVFALDR